MFFRRRFGMVFVYILFQGGGAIGLDLFDLLNRQLVAFALMHGPFNAQFAIAQVAVDLGGGIEVNLFGGLDVAVNRAAENNVFHHDIAGDYSGFLNDQGAGRNNLAPDAAVETDYAVEAKASGKVYTGGEIGIPRVFFL